MLLNKGFDIACRKTNAMANLDVADKLPINPAIDSANADVTFRRELMLRKKSCRIVKLHCNRRMSNRFAADTRKQPL